MPEIWKYQKFFVTLQRKVVRTHKRMRHFGLIGYPISHSQSAKIFREKFAKEGIDADYKLYPLAQIEELPILLNRLKLSGLNVTMPYKQAVIPYLDSLDPIAGEIGAVNVIQMKDGRLIGHNTDVVGFVESLRSLLRESDRRALILGTGGASRAVVCGLKQLGIKPTVVSRSSERGLTYGELSREVIEQHSIIINTTPLGMRGQTEEKPAIPYEFLGSDHLLFDLIYNPEETCFLREGRQRGCRTANGKEMLLKQAEAAWEIWAGRHPQAPSLEGDV